MCDKIHPFEEAGLGRAPFRVTGYYRDVGPHYLSDGMTQIGAPGQPMGTCKYCYQGIAICVSVQSADGKKFTVGCDCAEKVFLESNQSLTPIKRIRAEIAKEQRQAIAEKRRQAQQAKYLADLQSQRDRNGGLTDRELADKAREDQLLANRNKYRSENGWLIDAIKGQSGEFIRSMVDQLADKPLSAMSPRCLSILQDIYAKSKGRRGSKAYNQACEFFDSQKCPQLP